MRRFLRTTIGVVFSASQITAFVSFSYHMLWDCHHHEWFVFLFWVGGKHLEKPKNWGLWLPPKMIAFIQAYGKFMSSLHRSVVKFPIFLTTSWEQICLNCALCLSVLAISLHVCVCDQIVKSCDLRVSRWGQQPWPHIIIIHLHYSILRRSGARRFFHHQFYSRNRIHIVYWAISFSIDRKERSPEYIKCLRKSRNPILHKWNRGAHHLLSSCSHPVRRLQGLKSMAPPAN